MNIDTRQTREFTECLFPINNTLLEDALDYITRTFWPEDLFEESVLDDWATKHGYVKKD